MKRLIPSGVLLLCAAFGQLEPGPVFQNVDVHVTPAGEPTKGGRFRPGVRFEAAGFTLLDLIAKAYAIVDRDTIVGGPPWLGSDKFDILAEVPAGVRPGAVQPMLRALLADRFKLVVHNGKEALPVYALVPGKGALKEHSGGGDSECKTSAIDFVETLTCTNMSVAQFAQSVYDEADGDLDHSLLDKTGLTGKYDFSLRWTRLFWIRRDANGALNGTSVLDALGKLTGLKVELRKESIPVLAIDHVNRIPTANAPGVAAALRVPALTEFEVTEVRAHKPGSPFSFATYENRAEMLGLSLRNLIGEAYDVRGEELADGPKWIDTEPFDIIAKSAKRVPWENMQVMLQNLLEDRFKLTYHKEDRPLPVYALTVGKRTAKLKRGDPTRRGSCKKSLVSGGLELVCQNTTMAQFAEKARNAAPDYLNLPVVDLTGLSGVFDLAATWSPSEPTNLPGRGENTLAADLSSASTPTGELTFFEALEKQLGLRLQRQKHPMPVMVIDHVERPADD